VGSGFEPQAPHREVFTPHQDPCSHLGPTFWRAAWTILIGGLPGCLPAGGDGGAAVAGGVSGAGGRVVAGLGAACYAAAALDLPGGYGGPAASAARLVRRRLRCGAAGRRAARRASSSCQAWNAAAMHCCCCSMRSPGWGRAWWCCTGTGRRPGAALARARGPGGVGLGLRLVSVVVGGAGWVVRGGPLGLRGPGGRWRAVPQRRGEAFAALLGNIAVPDVAWRWPTVAPWSRQVPLLVGGQSR
jgi:hypothetical protein